MKKGLKELIKKGISKNLSSEEDLKKLKREISKEFKIDFLKNDEIRKAYLNLLKNKKIKKSKNFEDLLILKRTRSLSGVSVVAVLTKNLPCKNDCIYCPTETDMPESYLSNEPAVMRAIRLNFEPYLQTQKRMDVLKNNGHDISKIEFIVMGGTFLHLPEKYQYWFVLNCFKALNDYNSNTNKKPYSYRYNLASLKDKLKLEKNKNKDAKNRMVGLTLETRPDTIDKQNLIKFRNLGCTRVEIGIQSIYDDVLKINERGHLVKETIKATELLKYMGFKINYHIMPGLYGSNLKKDLKMFQELFSDERFKPDMLKIYPCVVTKNSKLYDLYQAGKYIPYSNKDLEKLIIKIKKIIPPYVRITRLIRDIPTVSIVKGPNIPNLREILKKKKILCKCIRCREIARNEIINSSKIILDRIDYEASNGSEIFLQIINQKDQILHAFLRLRINKKKALIKELSNASIIREVHTYGRVAPIDKKINNTSQHKGYGKILLEEAEKITQKEFNLNKIAVIASVGTTKYYKKFGFKEEDLYMRKKLK